MTSILPPLAALTLALLGHWILARARRRLPVWLARRAGRPSTAPEPALARRVTLVALPLEVALWVAATAVVVDAVPVLRAARDGVTGGLAAALRMPLFEADGRSYDLADVLLLPVLLAAVWAAASGLVHVTKTRVLDAVGVERGVQEALGTMLRIGLTTAGALVLLQVWGVNLRALAIAASVLGVGIGFGLQTIANNFVSGLLIGLERPVKPGDFVEVDGVQGTVERVGARSTAIRTLDEVTILVPNAKLLEHEVVNWSHAKRAVRLRLPVGVAYGSPVAAVRAALLDATRGHPAVLQEPRPRVELHAFGPSALEFELHVWTDVPRTQHVLKSDLNYRIESALRRRGITIPFSQHDVHLRSPQLERLAMAAAARWLPEAAGAELAAAAEAPDTGFDGELAARTWSDAAVTRVAAAMRGPGGVALRDRRHRLAVYRRCFVGSEAVAWLMAACDLDRDDAVALGQLLVDRGLIRHVLDEHGFRDGPFFYRFRADDVSTPAGPPASEPETAAHVVTEDAGTGSRGSHAGASGS